MTRVRGRSIHIGVNCVDDVYPTMPAALLAAEHDAEAMYALAVREGLEAIALCGPQATRAAVEQQVQEAANVLVAGDLCVVTFSGHGGALPDLIDRAAGTWPPGAEAGTPGDEEIDEYWALRDGVLIDDRIHELLLDFAPGVRVYVVSDSCYSGTIVRRKSTAAATAPVRVERRLAASVVLLAACLENRLTAETAQQGLFTQALLEVWRDGAFRASHTVFHEAIRARFESATVLPDGASDPAFLKSRPFTINPDAAGFEPPLKVHLCWFASPKVDPDCAAIAREIYEFLHRPVGDDPVQRPGLEIPVEYGRDLAGLLTALERPEYDADREPAVGARVVVVVLDRVAYGSAEHRETMARARARWPKPVGPGRSEVLLPIVLHEPWTRELGDVDQLLPGILLDAPDAARRWRLPSEVALVAGRALLRALGDPTPPRPKVLISHARRDGAEIAFLLAAHFQMRTRISAWYDETAVDRGDELIAQLEQAARDSVVLVVRTDRYSESPWCGVELLTAKLARTPMVTLLHGDDGEPTASTYGGNHRTMVWRHDRAWEVSAGCVQAWLHGHHFAAHAAAALAHAGLPANAEILARRPELLDLARPAASSGRRLLVYPDPPLTERDVALLRAAVPTLRLVTPNTMLGRVLLANDPRPPLAGRTIAFSLSHADDLPRFEAAGGGNGLTQLHLDDVLYTIVLTTLQSGARIAYGGDFRERDGYALKLSELHRARRRLGAGTASQLACFVDEGGARTGDADVDYLPIAVTPIDGATDQPDSVRATLWDMAMRHTMSRACHARIVLGGQRRPARDADATGYRGPWPGVLEEAGRTLDARQALYLVGGFGGMAGLLAEMLMTDRVPSELTAVMGPETRLTAEVDAARRALVERGGDRGVLLCDDDATLRTPEQMAQRILDRWRGFCRGDATAWDNGLSVGANRRLFRSTDRTEIAQLVFRGLRQVSREATTALELVLYHGDIASAADVDGYAVTTTPGLCHVGALDSLDRRMSDSLGRAIAAHPDLPEVLTVQIESNELAGRLALVARLDLRPSGVAMTPESVENLAAAVTRAADAAGLESIAMAPFATTLGLSTADSVLAMVRGASQARGPLPGRLVLCEVDRSRFEAIRTALDGASYPFLELRPGPPAGKPVETVVLHATATRAAADQPVSVRVTAYAPDASDAVIPAHSVTFPAADWGMLRRRTRRFDASLERGGHLGARLLSDAMRSLLLHHADRRLLLITDELASGLPWEMIGLTADSLPSIGAGLVRRVAMSHDARRLPDRTSTDAMLRVLLVADPEGNLPGAAAEGDAVVDALRGRPDIQLTPLRGPDATRDRLATELATGHHDVLHYAGHAFFDEADNHGGLCLANRQTFTAADLREQVPRLVVLGGCESARLRGSTPDEPDDRPRTDTHSLAESLLRAGVTTMVGTFFAVSDPAACAFARALYATLVAGKPIGEAVRDGRRELHRRNEADWGNFLLYGDDSLILS